MAQFSINDSRRPILEEIPDYSIEINVSPHHIIVMDDNIILAETDEAIVLQETRHRDVFYIPRVDVNIHLLTRTDLSTYCPFKGSACYWSFGKKINFAWSYEDPYPEVEAIRSQLSFHSDQVLIKAI